MLSFIAEEHPVVLCPEPDQRRLDIAELFCVALAREGVAGDRLEDLQGDRLLDSAKVGPGLVGPDDAFTHCARASSPIAAPGPSFSQSAMLRPKSARTSSFGIGGLCASHSSASATAFRSALLKVPDSSYGISIASRR